MLFCFVVHPASRACLLHASLPEFLDFHHFSGLDRSRAFSSGVWTILVDVFLKKRKEQTKFQGRVLVAQATSPAESRARPARAFRGADHFFRGLGGGGGAAQRGPKGQGEEWEEAPTMVVVGKLFYIYGGFVGNVQLLWLWLLL